MQAYTLCRAKGICELCKTKAPFQKEDGLPYLEIHHIKQLADGGPDTPDNTVALCPNCHRLLHHGSSEEKKEKIGKLRRSIKAREK